MEFGAGYKNGGGIYDDIRRLMTGRIATSRAGCQVLAEVISRVPDGIHVEIGGLWGGTAILAALMQNDNGRVYVIDPVTELGYYGGDDPLTKTRPTVKDLYSNFVKCGVEHKICHIDKQSYPWPSISDCDTAFIDGDHSFEAVYQDWMNVQARCSKYIVFDNVEPRYSGVEHVFTLACNHPGWKLSVLADGVGVIERT